MCDLIFDQSAHSIFARCQAPVVFRRLVFSEFLRRSFRESKLRFKFINKMETSWSRFVEITDEELIEFVEEQENTNKKRKTAYELFKNFIQTSNPSLFCSTSLHKFSPQVMNNHLSKFIFAVRKKDDSDYGPTSLRGFLSSIQRYPKKQNYGFTIFTDAVFKTAMATLRAKQNELKAKGLGSMHRTSDSLTEEEICKSLCFPMPMVGGFFV